MIKPIVLAMVALVTSSSMWSQQSAATGNPAAAGNKDNGKKIYERAGCWQCHGYAGQGGVAGATLTVTKLNAQGAIRYVRRPGGVMPAYTEKVITDRELTDVYAYIRSIPPAKSIDEIPLLKSLRDGK